MILIYTLFMLSVVAPMHSEKRFWKVIRKIRAGMDFASYWFYNLCAIGTVLFIAFFVIKGILKR